MSNLSKAQRDKLPDRDFCYVGKGKNGKQVRLFPALDQDDVDSAKRLIGKSPDPEGTKACFLAKCKAHGWTPPAEWVKDTANHSLLPPTELAALFAGEEMVIRRGKIWQAGEYPDTAYGMTPEEVIAASLDTTWKAPINSGHPRVPSPLDGLMGELRGLELDPEDGVSVIGDVAIPKWLDELLPPGEVPVSMEWNRQTKLPHAISIVMEPRISDAALVAAFAKRHDTDHGQAVIQAIHDRTAAGGAICKSDNTSTFASRHEAKAIQQIHDTTVEHGATCNEKGKGSLVMGPAYYSDARPEALRAGAEAPAQTGEQPRRGLMNLMQILKNAIASAPDDADPREVVAMFSTNLPAREGAQGQPAAPAGQSGQTPTAQFSSPEDQEKAALRAELQRERAKGITRDAENFADLVIAEERAFPMERDAIIAAYAQAAVDDSIVGVATFANGTQGTRVELLKKAYQARPEHQLTREHLGSLPEVAALFSRMQTQIQDPKNQEPNPERLQKLITMTPMGAGLMRNGAGGSS